MNTYEITNNNGMGGEPETHTVQADRAEFDTSRNQVHLYDEEGDLVGLFSFVQTFKKVTE